MTMIINTKQTNKTSPAAVTFRPGTVGDSLAVFKIFEQSVLELSRRLGLEVISGGQAEETMQQLWDQRRPLFEHLARTAEHFWLAEHDGQTIGYARSVWRDGLRVLTEFFVLPGRQSAGVGRELLRRVFPVAGAKHRALVATIDSRALVRYLKAGVYPRFATSYFSRPAEAVHVPTDLTFEPISGRPDDFETLRSLDKALLGHHRDEDHAWLLQQRQGYLYYRAGQPAGYGYLGRSNGPFALLDEADFPAVLAQAEREAVARGDKFGLEVPMINRAAVDYLLSRGYRMEPFITLFMSDEPFGHFERYVLPSPPFFL